MKDQNQLTASPLSSNNMPHIMVCSVGKSVILLHTRDELVWPHVKWSVFAIVLGFVTENMLDVAATLSALTAFIVYSNTLNADFAYDDT